jgi:hypothetical protein
MNPEKAKWIVPVEIPSLFERNPSNLIFEPGILGITKNDKRRKGYSLSTIDRRNYPMDEGVP